jgi:DNA-binding NarL/FixJ family response regulator
MARILIIDDDAKMRRVIGSILVGDGHEVREARNGREGTEMALQEPPELIICDVTMPEMNGHRVLEKLRGDPATAGVPFIFLTGWGEREDLRTGMNLGADDYLVKPVAPDELSAAVSARLQRHRLTGAPRGTSVAEATPEKIAAALDLTAREAEILSWVVKGKTNPEIGIILGIQLTTVKKHLESTFRKLGVETRTAAVTHVLEMLNG